MSELKVYCSFCNKSQDDVKIIVSGVETGAAICNDCLLITINTVIEDKDRHDARSEWQSIETAPKNGDEILVGNKGEEFSFCVRWATKQKNRVAVDGFYHIDDLVGYAYKPVKFNVWRHLPTPPKE